MEVTAKGSPQRFRSLGSPARDRTQLLFYGQKRFRPTTRQTRFKE
jgi:hypothetical protein